MYQLSSGNNSTHCLPAGKWLHHILPSPGVKYQVWDAMERRHDRPFIMTDVICCTFIYCSKWWTNAQSVPRDRVVKMSLWVSVWDAWQATRLFLSVSMPMVRQGDRLWLVLWQTVKLEDWLSNVCWHGDQLDLQGQAAAINEARRVCERADTRESSCHFIKHNTHSWLSLCGNKLVLCTKRAVIHLLLWQLDDPPSCLFNLCSWLCTLPSTFMLGVDSLERDLVFFFLWRNCWLLSFSLRWYSN